MPDAQLALPQYLCYGRAEEGWLCAPPQRGLTREGAPRTRDDGARSSPVSLPPPPSPVLPAAVVDEIRKSNRTSMSSSRLSFGVSGIKKEKDAPLAWSFDQVHLMQSDIVGFTMYVNPYVCLFPCIQYTCSNSRF